MSTWTKYQKRRGMQKSHSLVKGDKTPELQAQALIFLSESEILKLEQL